MYGYVRSMDILEIVKDTVEPKYLSGEVDKRETRTRKRTQIFSEQIQKGVKDMKVFIGFKIDDKLASKLNYTCSG